MSEEIRIGCSDGYCNIKGKAKGMHTNGGCRCVRDLMRDGGKDHMKRIALERVLQSLHSTIASQQEEIAELVANAQQRGV